MSRGIKRHQRFQTSIGKSIKFVRDLNIRPSPISNNLKEKLINLCYGCSEDTPVHIFSEVAVNRLQKQSRRADIVLYIPGVRLIYIEYKTIEKKGCMGLNEKVHKKQLAETYDNILANMTCAVSLCGSELKDTPLDVSVLLVSRRFWTGNRKDEVVVEYNPDEPRCLKEPSDPAVLKNMLSKLGRLYS